MVMPWKCWMHVHGTNVHLERIWIGIKFMEEIVSKLGGCLVSVL